MDSKQIKWRPFEWYVVCKQCGKEYVRGTGGPLEAEDRGKDIGVRIFNKEITEAFYFCSTKCHEDACKPARKKFKWTPAPPLLPPSAYHNYFKTAKEMKDAMDAQQPHRGIVELDDGWAAACCECTKLLTRGHEKCQDAFFHFNGYEGETKLWIDDTWDRGDPGKLKCWCSFTCKTAGEKRRDVMTKEEGKKMYRIVGIADGVLSGTEGDTPDDAISKLVAIQEHSQDKCDYWRWLYENKGYRVRSFTPKVEIDWPSKLKECAAQKTWGSKAECTLCKLVLTDDGRTDCDKCPLAYFAKTVHLEAANCPCIALYNKYAMEIGARLIPTFGSISWDRLVFISVLHDAIKFVKSGGMKVSDANQHS